MPGESGNRGGDMKYVKNETSLRKTYAPVVVTLDELNAIMAIMVSAGGKIDLSNNEYKFESIDEAKEHFGSVPARSFNISSYKPSASIDLDKSSATLHVMPSPTYRQLFHEIDDILAKCERKPRILYSYWMLLLATAPWLASLVWEVMFKGVPVLLGLQILIGLLLLWGQITTTMRHSVIIFQRRHERQTFFVRNRDAILLAVVTSLISGAIGYGFAKMREPATTSTNAPAEGPK
jgi:hypothetical protein